MIISTTKVKDSLPVIVYQFVASKRNDCVTDRRQRKRVSLMEWDNVFLAKSAFRLTNNTKHE